MHLLIVTLADHFSSGRKVYFGPFPTYFRANEYGKLCTELDGYIRHEVVKLTIPHNMRVNFK